MKLVAKKKRSLYETDELLVRCNVRLQAFEAAYIMLALGGFSFYARHIFGIPAPDGILLRSEKKIFLPP
jgi:hypothetical protein